MTPKGPVEVWRGGVRAWECDDMGHMNVRFYVARAMQGLAGVAAALGMPDAFRAQAAASLVVRQHHIRFLNEARAGTPLHMTAGVLAMGEADATLLQTLVHSRTGKTAATFVTQVSHVSAREGRVFPWPHRAHAAAEALQTEATAEAGPRGLTGPPPTATEAAQAGAFGPAARGMVAVEDCDLYGRMRTELVLGKISDGIPHLIGALRRESLAAAGPDRRIGGAAVEYQLSYFGAPAAGDLYMLRAGLVAVDSRKARMRHWLVDALTGAPWAAAENLSVHFDLDERRVLTLPPEAVARLQEGLADPAAISAG